MNLFTERKRLMYPNKDPALEALLEEIISISESVYELGFHRF